MPIGFWFWLLMVIWLLFGGWFIWWPQGRFVVGGNVLLWILLALLGWHAFGNVFSALVH